MKPTRHAGFTLIELMIVVVIIGIIAAFGYPNYTRYVIETRRSDGQIALTQMAAIQEKFFTECNTYTINITAARIPCAGGGLGLSLTSPGGNYALTVAPMPGAGFTIANSFLLTATPEGVQFTQDTDCGALTLNSVGVKSQLGPNTGGRCWRK